MIFAKRQDFVSRLSVVMSYCSKNVFSYEQDLSNIASVLGLCYLVITGKHYRVAIVKG